MIIFKFYIKRFLYFLLFFFISTNCLALAEHIKLWTGINASQTLTDDRKWLSFIFSQLRFIDQGHPLQVALLEGGMGYRVFSHDSIWVGYRWSGHNPYNDFYQENRLFQQYIWHLQPQHMVFRTRLEEIERTNQSQLTIRLRQRFALEGTHSLFRKAFSFVYDEIFFQLNNTNYMSSKFISENRLFLGLNLNSSKQAWWEIGYINQFQFRTPQENQNQMSHIASLNYNFS
jgi:hypothetical protein